jgi:zinc/manganese transport system substrate-binding protein
MKLRHLLITLLGLALPAAAFAKNLQVVTTTEDLAAIAREIGGNHTDISAIAKGYQDAHFVDAKPSYLLKLKRADLLIAVGLELEVGWLPSLLTSARNPRILPGNAGFMNASVGCDVLQKPQGAIDRSMGDIHPEGNPHYWLDPENGRVIARHVAEKFSSLDAANAADYRSNLARFESALTEKEKAWSATAAGFKRPKVITYHNSFPNFAKAFGLEIVNNIEPKPGVPPSPGHVQSLIAQIKAEKVPLLLIEPYFDDKLPAKIGREAGATLLIFPPSVGGVPAIKTYFDLFDYDLKLIADALAARRT